MSDAAGQGSNTLMQQAYEQLAGGRFEEAVETFSAALAVDPDAAGAWRGRGLAHAQLKRWSLAAADFEAAAHRAPEESDHWIEWARSLAMDDQVYPAIGVFETLLTQQPACLRGHLELGLLHLRLGAIPKGRQQLQQALACRPSLEQRRQIEAILAQQDTLDRKRFYRPDFEALHREEEARRAVGFAARLRAWWTRWRRGSSVP